MSFKVALSAALEPTFYQMQLKGHFDIEFEDPPDEHEEEKKSYLRKHLGIGAEDDFDSDDPNE